MITDKQKNLLLENMVELLELPDSAYEKAKNRYEDLGEWFGREKSLLKYNDPHIFPQGSFRLGTAIRPLSENEEYDLDLGCKLKSGISKEENTQYELKTMIGKELESYREARKIEKKKEEKHRCWRLEYKDKLNFHMDIVPCIPLSQVQMDSLSESIRITDMNQSIIEEVATKSISITDDRNEKYKEITDNWNISNPEGYGQWFEVEMNQFINEVFMDRAEVDEVPDFKLKTPLQRVIQLLKRHRDTMFKDDEDIKPISIIITTLATRAYSGEKDLESALTNILSTMEKFIKPNTPRVENPVNPKEDFADRWAMEQYKHLNLEKNFREWLTQVNFDFNSIRGSTDSEFLARQIEDKFSVTISKDTLIEKLGLTATTTIKSKEYTLNEENTTSPWMVIE